jgi:hypothetical protein
MGMLALPPGHNTSSKPVMEQAGRSRRIICREQQRLPASPVSSLDFITAAKGLKTRHTPSSPV